MMFNNDEKENGKIDLKYLLKFDIIYLVACILALLDFLTTTYGISQAIELQGLPAILMSLLLAGMFLFVIIISKKIGLAVDTIISDRIRNLPVKTEQQPVLDFIAENLPSAIVFIFGLAFLILDFLTSLQGVDALVPFKGYLGFIVKYFAVLALVFSTAYLIYWQPQKRD